MYIIKNWIGTFYKHAQWLQCSGLPRLCFLKRFAKIKQSAYLTQTFPLILWLRTPSKLLITAPGRQFGTENLVNTLINWIRFHVEQTKSGEFVILGFLIITSSHFFTYWPLIIEIKKKWFSSQYIDKASMWNSRCRLLRNFVFYRAELITVAVSFC